MRIALGIDTGGTYTDAVLVDQDTGQVLTSAKALTTRYDLAVGIGEAMAAVFAGADGSAGAPSAGQVVLVGLSTTLATNAMVEGQGGPVCLLLIGYDPELMAQYGFERELATRDFVYVAGGHGENGDPVAPLDEAAIVAAATARRDTVEAFAVSGYFSVRNPEHELRAAALIEAITGLPVTCGHELSSRLNAVRRATTAALNARLIAPLRDLIATVRRSLDEMGIAAPLMVVKGDGSLVQAAWAQRRPIETILSGPAASVVGAWHLAGRRDAWVVDVGGTTTDIAALRDGWPTLNADGARVGGWRTMVQAIDVHTTGLGGDSHVRPSDDGDTLAIGPRRVVPLSLLAAKHPETLAELRLQVAGSDNGHQPGAGEFVLAWRPPASRLIEIDQELLEKLAAGPTTLPALAGGARRFGLLRSRVEDLTARGLAQRSAFTPTDALHALGRLDLWQREAAQLGAELLARRLDRPVEVLCEQVVAGVAERVATALVTKALEDETGRVCDWAHEPMAGELLGRALGRAPEPGRDLDCRLSLQRPIVAIGAPVEAYMPRVAEMLHTELTIPPHAEVANAVGAVAGGVIQRVEVVIEGLSGREGGMRVFLPDGCHDFYELEEAARYAEQVMTPYATELARQAGAEHVEVQYVRQDHWARTAGSDGLDPTQRMYLSSDLTFTATGRPAATRE